MEPTYMVAVPPNDDVKILPFDEDNLLSILYREIGHGLVNSVPLSSKLTMWVYDESIARSMLINFPAMAVASAVLRGPAQPYYGTAVFTGSHDEQGNLSGLDDRCSLLVGMLIHLPTADEVYL